MSGAARLGVALVPLLAGLVAGVVLIATPRSPTPSLSSYAGRIEYTDEHDSDGRRIQTWIDPVAQRVRRVEFSPHPPVTTEAASYRLGGVDHAVLVVEGQRSYSLERVRLTHGCRPSFAPNSAAVWAGQLRDYVARRAWAVVGPQTVEGHPALSLRLLHPQSGSGFQLWVDPATYVPLRERLMSGSGSALLDIRWLARTPATATLARPTIPVARKRVRVVSANGQTTTFRNDASCS